MSDSWNRILSEIQTPLHDLARSPSVGGAERIVTGVALLGGVMIFGPELAAAGGVIEGFQIASGAIAGTANTVLGAVAVASAQPMNEAYEAASNPLDYSLLSLAPERLKELVETERTLAAIKDLLTGDGLERVQAACELTDRIADKLGESRLDRSDLPDKAGADDSTQVDRGDRDDLHDDRSSVSIGDGRNILP